MSEVSYDKTRDRSVVGSMNDFRFMANWRDERRADDLTALSVDLADTPCGPLRWTWISESRIRGNRCGGTRALTACSPSGCARVVDILIVAFFVVPQTGGR